MPAHQFLLSGTSAQTAPPNTLFAAENPGKNVYENDTGCTALAGETVNIIDPSGSEDYTPIYPCFDHNTLTDLLDNASHGWKYYSNTTGSIWTRPTRSSIFACPPPRWMGPVKARIGLTTCCRTSARERC